MYVRHRWLSLIKSRGRLSYIIFYILIPTATQVVGQRAALRERRIREVLVSSLMLTGSDFWNSLVLVLASYRDVRL